jgi:hypothetical protein
MGSPQLLGTHSQINVRFTFVKHSVKLRSTYPNQRKCPHHCLILLLKNATPTKNPGAAKTDKSTELTKSVKGRTSLKPVSNVFATSQKAH